MKFPLASTGAAAVLAAGLILAPGLSPAQASEVPAASSVASTSGTTLMGSGTVATSYGMFFLPCTMWGIRFC